MKTISRNQVQRLFSAHIYEQGLIYYKKKRVLGLSYNKHSEAWFAEVEGSELYYVEVDLTKLNEGRIRTYCECPAFNTHHSCKHLAAVMLEIANQRSIRDWNTQDTHEFIEGILLGESQPTTEKILDKTPMKVEYYLKLDQTNKIWLELKTGIDHCYVIRSVREFLQHVLQHEEHYFTKNFSYDPDSYYFLKQDMDILETLQEFIQTGDLFTDRSYDVENAYDRREFLIPPMSFFQLLEKIKERNLLVEIGNQYYQEIEIKKNEFPVSFSVNQDKDKQLLLKMNGVEGIKYFPEYNFVFQEGVFYFPTDSQLNVMRQIRRLGIRNHELPISHENADTFFSEALPVLKQASDINIEEEIAKDIIEYPLQAKLYLHEENNVIVGQLTYHYGPFELEPFTKKKEKQIIIRDVRKEQHIMNLIEQSNFHYNGKELYLKMEDDEEVYDFLYTILPKLDSYVELFLTTDIQNLIIDYEPIPSATVNVQGDSNLLEIGFDISGVNEDEVTALFGAVIEKKRYYRLNSGALISLETEKYEAVGRLFEELKIRKEDFQDSKVMLPAYRGMQIDDLEGTKINYQPSFQKLLNKLKSPEEQVYELPDGLQAELRHYQETGYQWFKSLSSYHLGGILADDMGLGKTLQTIAYLLSEPSDKPHLVVVPSSVIYNWRNECRKFAPELKVAVVSGSPEERAQIIEESRDMDIWITSYGTVRQDINQYIDISFQTLILDEAQYIKNYFTKTSRAIRDVKAEKRFALSGTPIENSIDELWAIFQVILPGLLPSQSEFRQMDREKISTLTRPFILRRVKTDVLKELPEKIESVHISELTKEQKELYIGYLQQLQEETSASLKGNQFQKNRMKILAGLTRLRQLCCHPSLFIENYEGRSGKLDELMETVQTMLDSGKRMLIFSQFTSMHQLIIQELNKLGVEYFYLHGQTPSKERVEMSEAFNNGEKNVFLISLRAGGTGLNLTGADTVILYDLWWNPAVEDQAAGRAHRFGQKNIVQVIRFITEGTIEEKIYELQQKKRELIDQVIQPGETMLTSLSEEDVRELLNI
ncbi:DEAD/DEAH box helicase [Pseudogracilibacillus sp. SE30717A]|uniref:DEAD/DEAH box helicase n=1 Tax=Pseudogracilibacillus sp. SE30717A TaxID=3098293 RepID=UPI00300E27DE